MRRSSSEALEWLSKRLAEFLPGDVHGRVLQAVGSGPTGRACSFRLVDRPAGQPLPPAKQIIASICQEVTDWRPGQQPLSALQSGWFPRAYALAPGHVPLSKYEIQKLSAVVNGLVYFQSLASMLPALCLDARPNTKVLDLCAAPGGKATLVAADRTAMAGTGHLLAVDDDFPRLQRLLHNTRLLLGGPTSSSTHMKQHVHATVGNMTVVKADGRQLQVDNQGMPNLDAMSAGDADLMGRPKARGGPFDRVLVDAPCSSSGRIQLHDPKTFQQSELLDLSRHTARQKQLLWNGASLLRNGGVLVYSTCSLFPEENEDIVQWLLDNHHQMSLCDVTAGPAVAAAANSSASLLAGANTGIGGSGTGAAYGVRCAPTLRMRDLLTQPASTQFEQQLMLSSPPSWSIMPGLQSYQGHKYAAGMSTTMRLLPCWNHEGFFVAKFRKRS